MMSEAYMASPIVHRIIVQIIPPVPDAGCGLSLRLGALVEQINNAGSGQQFMAIGIQEAILRQTRWSRCQVALYREVREMHMFSHLVPSGTFIAAARDTHEAGAYSKDIMWIHEPLVFVETLLINADARQLEHLACSERLFCEREPL